MFNGDLSKTSLLPGGTGVGAKHHFSSVNRAKSETPHHLSLAPSGLVTFLGGVVPVPDYFFNYVSCHFRSVFVSFCLGLVLAFPHLFICVFVVSCSFCLVFVPVSDLV